MEICRVGLRAVWFRGGLSDCGNRASQHRVTILLCCFLFSSLTFFAGSVASHQFGPGAIEGTVLDSAGMPIKNATVYVLQSGRTPESITDDKGNFVIAVRAGQHRVLAYKESESYPNPLWSFYSDAQSQAGFPVVSVREGLSLRGIIVRLGPKASRLLVKVTDARTKRPVPNATISLSHEGKPQTRFNSGATGKNGELLVLVPSNTPINLVVGAADYRTWNYRAKTPSKSNALQLKPDENKTIVIELLRSP